MSKIAKRLTAVSTNRKFIVDDLDPSMYTEASFTIQKLENFAYEYYINLKINAKAYLTEKEILESKSDIMATETVQSIKRSIVEEVFGEFRLSIEKIRHALYNNNVKEANTKLNDLYRQMFEDGL